MKTCDTTSNCARIEYSCVFPENITQSGAFSETVLPVEERVARIIDLDLYKAEAKICVALSDGRSSVGARARRGHASHLARSTGNRRKRGLGVLWSG